MLLINPYRFAAPRSSDADVNSYILAVEAADGQELEAGVITAVESFILGCKSDGIWDAIKASCILAGARTLNGALVPLTGTAPTNFNFVSADYNRKTGLKGNGSTKYLNTNRNNNADPQNSKHLAVYATQLQSGTAGVYLGGQASTSGHSFILCSEVITLRMAINMTSAGNIGSQHALGLMGCNRSNSAAITGRAKKFTSGNGITTIAVGSNAPANYTPNLFRRHLGDLYSNARLSFYSIGQSIDLALLDTRVSTLMTDLAAAI